MTKNEKGGLLGYNNTGNMFGRDKDAQEPEGERVGEPKEMPRHEYYANMDKIPDEDVNIN